VWSIGLLKKKVKVEDQHKGIRIALSSRGLQLEHTVNIGLSRANAELNPTSYY